MVFPLPELAPGSVVLLDANIFVYGFLGQSQQCKRLIDRCQKGGFLGITTTEVVGEVCHRLMLAEALESGVISRPNAAALRLKRDAIKGLHRYWEMAAQIFHANLLVIGSDEGRHRAAQDVRGEHGLLTNDSLIVAAAFEYGIRSVATHDSDFDRISDLAVYSPTDLP